MPIESDTGAPAAEHGSARPLRILIADDHPLLRDAIAAMISDVAGWEICGVAADGPETLRQATELRPDVIVLDLHMPGFHGAEAMREIKRQVPSAEMVIFSGAPPDTAAELFQAGARSFISKNASSADLVAAITAAAAHKSFITAQMSDVLLEHVLEDSRQPDSRVKVTAREREVIRRIAEGESNKHIGNALGISSRTAETHRAAIMRKLGASSVAEIVRYAIRNGIVEA